MARSYNLKLVQCTINGVAVSGYGESDAIGFEWDSDIWEVTKTADGKVLYSATNDRALSVTITLSQLSRAHLLLNGFQQAQSGDLSGGLIVPGVIAPFPFYLVDPSTGEEWMSPDTVFMNRPAPSKGRTVGDVQYRVHLPEARVILPVANIL